MSYAVKELFLTLQGEGAQTGRRAVFLRFAGCNLWTGREQDRAKAVCTFCDTDFVGTDGPGGGKFADANMLKEPSYRIGTAQRLGDSKLSKARRTPGPEADSAFQRFPATAPQQTERGESAARAPKAIEGSSFPTSLPGDLLACKNSSFLRYRRGLALPVGESVAIFRNR